MKKSLAIIGGGPASMSLACFIDTSKYDVTIYERNKALGRKFLVAGLGGFNLTHSIEMSALKEKYRPQGFLDHALDSFTNIDFQSWLNKLGIATFSGSSGRVFPSEGMKPIEVLNLILEELERNKIVIKTGFEWDNNVTADVLVFAMGGGSWSVTGSDGKWTKHFENVNKLEAVNCAFGINWPKAFIDIAEGKPLKNIVLEYASIKTKGELVITKFGLEGNAIYAMSFELQEALKTGPVTITMDLKKHLTFEKVLEKLEFSKEKTITNSLKRDLKMHKQSILLLQHYLTKEEYLNPQLLALKIKSFPVELLSTAPIEEAISTIGGIPIEHLSENFEMTDKPNHFCIGEMVDWHAPTGGYLLQGCFSMGHHLAKYLNSDFGS